MRKVAAVCWLTLIVALVVSTNGDAASEPGSVSGGGTRGAFTLAGSVRLLADGEAVGHFVIVLNPPDGGRPFVCRYNSFTNVWFAGNVASFQSTGFCTGESGPFESVNVFGIVDNGEPGAGVDSVDVNFLGPSGIAVPGGVIDTGNFQVRTP